MRRSAGIISVALLLSACRAASAPSSPPAGSMAAEDFQLPTTTLEVSPRAGYASGTLVLVGACLRLDTGADPVPLLWPRGYRAARRGTEVVVLVGAREVAVSGRPVVFGGGYGLLGDVDDPDSCVPDPVNAFQVNNVRRP